MVCSSFIISKIELCPSSSSQGAISGLAFLYLLTWRTSSQQDVVVVDWPWSSPILWASFLHLTGVLTSTSTWPMTVQCCRWSWIRLLRPQSMVISLRWLDLVSLSGMIGFFLGVCKSRKPSPSSLTGKISRWVFWYCWLCKIYKMLSFL